MQHAFDYLILGAGMAGEAAAQALREADANASIGMLGEESHPPYDRPPLTKALWKDGKESDMWRPIDKARAHNEHSRHLRGASTISQQVAKNLFCWSGRSYLRKAVEAWYTVLIEFFWPKQRILEVYANIAEFGDGIYGAEAAAQSFFGKPASALSLAESARLAAVLPNPKKYSARNPGSYVAARARWIQRQVGHLGGSAYLSSAP